MKRTANNYKKMVDETVESFALEVAFEDRDGFVLDVTEDLRFRGGLYAPDWQYQDEEMAESGIEQMPASGEQNGAVGGIWMPGFFHYKPMCAEGKRREPGNG